MEMKKPMHPGEVLKVEIEELGLAVADVAKAMGCTRQQLYRVLNAQSAVTAEMALRIEKAFGGSAELWMRMQVLFDVSKARRQKLFPAAKKLNLKAA
jgi:antitoxin HigA-1